MEDFKTGLKPNVILCPKLEGCEIIDVASLTNQNVAMKENKRGKYSAFKDVVSLKVK